MTKQFKKMGANIALYIVVSYIYRLKLGGKNAFSILEDKLIMGFFIKQGDFL